MRLPATRFACCLGGLVAACCLPPVAGAGQTPLAALDAAILAQPDAVRTAHDLPPLEPNGEPGTVITTDLAARRR